MAWSSRFYPWTTMRISTMGQHRPFYPLGEAMYEQLLEDLKATKKIYLHRVLHH